MKKGLSNPFNYTGSKHRYLDDLFSILPVEDNLTVLDPFFGGGDLSMHLNKTWAVDAVDRCAQLIEMHESIRTGALNVESVFDIINKNNLSKTGKIEYLEFRDRYNKSPSPVDLYALICHANSNRMRFSTKKNEFNMSSGSPCRYFNLDMQKKLNDYIDRLSVNDVYFHCASAFDFDFSLYDLVLIDPPYSHTVSTYNERGGWDLDLEFSLINKIKSECSKNKFVYFGQTFSNGVQNNLTSHLCEIYKFKILKSKKSVSHNRKNGKTVDVMIWNF